jgi:outer membrane protein assembly factor BamB
MLGVIFAGSRPLAAGDNWPQWRGPAQNGVSDSTGLPLAWGPDQNIVWKTELPSWSGGTPIIWGDRIFLTSPAQPDPEELKKFAEDQARQREEGQGRRGRGRMGGGLHPGGQELLLLCLDRRSGAMLWERALDTGNEVHMKANNSSPSPVTDGEHVWVVTGNGVVTAFDMEGGQIWQKNLQAMYGAFGLNWGYASSPLLHDGKLIIEVLHGFRTDDPSYVVAFDAPTGEVLWKVERPTDAPREAPDAYTTPIVVEKDGRAQIVISGADYVTGHDPETGRELWRVGGLNPQKRPNYRIVASPVFAGGMVYAPTRNRPLLAIDLSGPEAPDDDAVAWKWDDNGSPDVPTPACDGERFYMVDDKGVATCLDARTGQVIWGPQRTVQGTVSGSPLLADGRLYFTNEEAVTVVLSAGPTFEILATNQLDGTYTLSSPVPSGRHLFIRTGQHLYCIGATPPEQ